MFILLYIMVLTIISSLVLFRQNGKREILKLDFVQFIYAFLLAPTLFVCIKTFLYYFWKQQREFGFTLSQYIFLDTALSVFLMFIYAFIVIHSLTKTFSLKIHQDPLHDIFEHSEFFHLWTTHIVIYTGAVLILAFFSLLNVFAPLPDYFPRWELQSVVAGGFVTGALAFMGVTAVHIKNFGRVMKLLWGAFFLMHVWLYFAFDLSFTSRYLLFWLMFAISVSFVSSSLLWQSRRAKTLVSRFRHRHDHNRESEYDD